MGNNYQIHVIDNDSTDRTVELATAAGAEVYVQKCSQAEALNLIVARSNAKCTLLIHSDIMMLEENWFAECQIELDAEVILLSPQDIGCGPYTRPFGIGMPESFFLFFDTEKSRKARITRWNRRIRFPYRKRVVDYFGPHVTHNIPHWCIFRPMVNSHSGLI